ncbi:MAG: L-alanine-DL-glutamate epimerase [Chitinophagaceae bacterium]|nr:L-alanine-DL-glutamate epimerase [Chitinophagaceae bacterium]MCW5927747.1 L-alanine-DL-glutamate epimerase [Chitinophagaceae bacterium]
MKKIRISSVDCNFEREPLIRPLGFKGGFVTELWQVASLLQSATGTRKVGLSTQSILWSDPAVYTAHSESGGNALMYTLTEYALQLVKGRQYSNPVDLQNQILEEVYAYGKKITGNPDLRETFVLNALVSLDNAAWMLYAAENGIGTFDEMIPEQYRSALSYRHNKIAGIPLISYNSTVKEIKEVADSGYYFLKIKLGQPGTQEEMLARDMEHVSAIHKAIGHYSTPYTTSGKLLYYFDANGRYEKKETLLRLIDHLKKIGAFGQVAIIEEPFPEKELIDVSDIPLRLAADESAHTERDVQERIRMGYKAIALKPIAKTLSMTLGMAKIAKAHHVPCLCADLTVNPVLVDWNKNVAARLEPFPGLNTGLLESNGPQNYKNWSIVQSYHPYPDAGWGKVERGVFNLDTNFYEKSGGVLSDSKHYMELFNKNNSIGY